MIVILQGEKLREELLGRGFVWWTSCSPGAQSSQLGLGRSLVSVWKIYHSQQAKWMNQIDFMDWNNSVLSCFLFWTLLTWELIRGQCSGTVVSTVASQQEGHGFESPEARGFSGSPPPPSSSSHSSVFGVTVSVDVVSTLSLDPVMSKRWVRGWMNMVWLIFFL